MMVRKNNSKLEQGSKPDPKSQSYRLYGLIGAQIQNYEPLNFQHEKLVGDENYDDNSWDFDPSNFLQKNVVGDENYDENRQDSDPSNFLQKNVVGDENHHKNCHILTPHSP